jgi:hypothetical protein
MLYSIKEDTMAETITEGKTVEKAKKKDDLVEFEAFYDGDKYKDDIFVCINGKPMQIKRGEKVMIPRAVAEVLEQSINADRQTARMMDSLANEFATESKKY